MSHWSDEEFDYYNRVSFPMKAEENRKIIYKHLTEEFNKNEKFSWKYAGLFNSGYEDFLHWFDVA